MSTYEYYEWQAVDRPLSSVQLREVSRLSSHMEVVTPVQAVVTYSWGSFKHDPIEVLLRCFDAFLYWANWGSRELAFRFPKAVVDRELLEAYWVDDWLTLRESGDYLWLDLDMASHEPGRWEEAEELGLSSLVPLRQQIIEGDCRALYLAWLKAVEESDSIDPEDLEPPVPAGLRELDPSLDALAWSLLDLDPFLLEAAAAASPPRRAVSDEDLAGALAKLPAEECRAYLLQLVRSEAPVRASLRKRLARLAGLDLSPRPGSRTAARLLEEAERLRAEDRRRRQEAAERERRRELEDLAKREDSVWREIDALIQRGQPGTYDKATALLTRLREVAEFQNRLPGFEARVAELKSRYSRRPSLMERLKDAGL